MGSPDLWDTVCFFFLEDVNYIFAESGAGSSGGSVAATAQEKVDGMFADV